MELLDELSSGVPAIGAPAIQASFGASYTSTAWALLLVPTLVALVLEPILFLLADRHPRRWFVCGGLLGMAVSALAAALAPNLYVLTAAMALAFVSTGCGVTIAQATLIDAEPAARERAMTRWVLFGGLGDLLAPALMAGLAAAALGWRAGYAIVGALLLACALALLRQPFPAVARDDEPDEPLLAALRAALGNRRLLLWLAGVALCDLLDEILVVFASLHLRDVAGIGPVGRSLVLGGFVAGGLVGLAISERLLRRIAPLRLLGLSAVSCAALYLAWLAVTELWLSVLLLTAVGVVAAPMYPLAAAQAYAAMPDRSGAVNAAGHLFTPVMLGLPWLLGWLADRHGTGAALLVLAIQPVALALVAGYAARSTRPSA